MMTNLDSHRPTVGLALGGGFARGVAHIGVLKVLQEEGIPIDYLAGVSAGGLVAAAFASGATVEEIARLASLLRFSDVASWTIGKLGFFRTDAMDKLFSRLLKRSKFEELKIPLAIVATDLMSGEPVVFSESGDICVALRASCAIPGVFQPVRLGDKMLTDGSVSMDVPAKLVHDMGADYVISVGIPCDDKFEPTNLLEVMSRSLQILQARTVESWRRHTDLVIEPHVSSYPWHDFTNAERMVAAGEMAALGVLPQLKSDLARLSSIRAFPESSPAAA